MKIKIDGKSYDLPTNWAELKVKDYTRLLDYFGKINPEVKKKVTNEEELSDDEIFNFVIGWTNALLGIDIDTLKRVDIDDLSFVFSLTNFALGAPSEYIKMNKLNGVEITDSITTASGMEMLGAGATYEQWILLNKLHTLMIEEADVKNINNLKQFLTVVYPVKNESSEQVAKRMADMDNLSALELWSGWFFFVQWIYGWRNFTQFLGNDQRTLKGARLRARLVRHQLWHAFVKSKIGRFLHIKSPKRACWDLIMSV